MSCDKKLKNQHVYDDTLYMNDVDEKILDWIYNGNEQLREDDVVVSTYPKSGTAWLRTIAWFVLNHHSIKNIPWKHIYDVVPMLEKAQPGEMEGMSSPRAMVSHLPLTAFSKHANVTAKKTRIIYGLRNPKDTLVSYYHHCKIRQFYGDSLEWNEFFQLFKDNQVPYGNWFERVSSWWGQRDKFHIFFIKYEDMIKDHRGSIKRIADFLEQSLTDETIDEIVRLTTFSSMRDTWNQAAESGSYNKALSHHMRKGGVGDWKNYFSQEQSDFVDQMYKTYIEGSGLSVECEI